VIFLAGSALTGRLLGLGTRRPAAVALLLTASVRDFAIAVGLAVATSARPRRRRSASTGSWCSSGVPPPPVSFAGGGTWTHRCGPRRRLRPDRSGPETEPRAAVAGTVTAGPSWPCDAPHAGTARSRLGCMATWLQVRRGCCGGGAAIRFARHPGAMSHPHAGRDDAGHRHDHELSESGLARLRHVLRPHGRAEDLAGIAIVLDIAASSALAAVMPRCSSWPRCGRTASLPFEQASAPTAAGITSGSPGSRRGQPGNDRYSAAEACQCRCYYHPATTNSTRRAVAAGAVNLIGDPAACSTNTTATPIRRAIESQFVPLSAGQRCQRCPEQGPNMTGLGRRRS
jgi:hypothetical protein